MQNYESLYWRYRIIRVCMGVTELQMYKTLYEGYRIIRLCMGVHNCKSFYGRYRIIRVCMGVTKLWNKSSLKNANKLNSTKLSMHIWNLKIHATYNGQLHEMRQHRTAEIRDMKKCQLCLLEHFYIICYTPELGTLNKLASG